MKKIEWTEEVVAGHYHHVDNGGLTIEVVSRRYPSGADAGVLLRVRDGYHGYSEHVLEFHEVNTNELRKFAEALMVAANKLDQKPSKGVPTGIPV